MKPIEPVKVKQYLTDEDIVRYSKQNTRMEKDIEALIAEAKATANEFKARIGRMKLERAELVEAIDEGYIMVTHTGSKRKNYAEQVWEYTDGQGRVVDRKPFAPADMQMSTDDVEAKERQERVAENADGEDADLDALASKIQNNLDNAPDEETESDTDSVADLDEAETIDEAALDSMSTISDEEARAWEDNSDLRVQPGVAPLDEPVATGDEDQPAATTAEVLTEPTPKKRGPKPKFKPA